PDSIAVFSEGAELTYRSLNERANQLARYLRTLGVGPEVRVGLCVERGASMIVGMLGIHKAGGAYLPVDPSYPKQRLAFLLQDAEARIVLTQQRLLECLPDCIETTVCLDSDWKKVSRRSKENLADKVEADNVAYVMYTSGSNAEPKGVEV